MNILHVIPAVSEREGGPSQAAFDMYQALRELHGETTLVTTNQGLDENAKQEITCRFGSGQIEMFPYRWGDSFKYSPQLAGWLNQNVRNFDLVHIHAVFNHASLAAAKACRAGRVPYIVRPLGTLDPWGMKQKSLRKKLFWHAAGKTMMREAAAVHYTSEGERQAVEDSLKLRRGFVVPLGVNLPNGSTPGLSLSEILPGFHDDPYVLVLSRLLPTKGIHVLLNAFLSLVQRKEFMNWRLVLAGEGPHEYVASLKRKIGENVAGDFVWFTGWLNGLRKDTVLRNASVLALPSQHENFGLCVMEAMARGVPVLVSPQVNLSLEIITAGAGWVAGTNENSLERTLATALSSETERERRGRAGLKLAQKFDWKVIAEQLSEVYERVIADSSSI